MSFNIDALRSVLTDPVRTIASSNACTAAATQVDNAARHVALQMNTRAEILTEFAAHSSDSLWSRLGAFWPALADALEPSSTVGIEEARQLAFAAAKLERNLVAGVNEYQLECLPHAPDIRRLIFNVTTFSRIEDEDFFSLQATLAQLLCNLVSPVDNDDASAKELADSQLAIYLSGNREDDVVIRLLDSRNARTNVATLHLLNNLTQDETRLSSLLEPIGIRWLAQILGRMDDWLDHDDGRFELAARIFNRMIEQTLTTQLFEDLAMGDEVITPSQTTLLKLVDSALAAPPAPRPNPLHSQFAFILPLWHNLAKYAVISMRSGQDDARLPKILIGLVLACESLSAIALNVQERIDEAKYGGDVVVPGGDEAMVAAMKSGPQCVIPPLVGVLRETNTFLPRIKPTAEAPDASLPFANVKRDLVRLLAVLAFDDPTIGDAVRAEGGVELVLSLCETDDRNPYLREHALLAVRNLMMGNPANQEIMRQMDPVGVVGDNGELLPLPEKLKKKMAEDKAKQAEAATIAEEVEPTEGESTSEPAQ